MKWSIDSDGTRSGKITARVLLGKEPVGMVFLNAAEHAAFGKLLADGTERDREIDRIRRELEAMQIAMGKQAAEDAEPGLAERCRSAETDLAEHKAALEQTRGKLADAETRAILAEDRARKRSNDDFEAGAQDVADDVSEAFGEVRGRRPDGVVEHARNLSVERDRLAVALDATLTAISHDAPETTGRDFSHAVAQAALGFRRRGDDPQKVVAAVRAEVERLKAAVAEQVASHRMTPAQPPTLHLTAEDREALAERIYFALYPDDSDGWCNISEGLRERWAVAGACGFTLGVEATLKAARSWLWSEYIGPIRRVVKVPAKEETAPAKQKPAPLPPLPEVPACPVSDADLALLREGESVSNFVRNSAIAWLVDALRARGGL